MIRCTSTIVTIAPHDPRGVCVAGVRPGQPRSPQSRSEGPARRRRQTRTQTSSSPSGGSPPRSGIVRRGRRSSASPPPGPPWRGAGRWEPDEAAHLEERPVEHGVDVVDHVVEVAEELEGDHAEQLRPRRRRPGPPRRSAPRGTPGRRARAGRPGASSPSGGRAPATASRVRRRPGRVVDESGQDQGDPAGRADGVLGRPVAGHGRPVDQGVLVGVVERPPPDGPADGAPPCAVVVPSDSRRRPPRQPPRRRRRRRRSGRSGARPGSGSSGRWPTRPCPSDAGDGPQRQSGRALGGELSAGLVLDLGGELGPHPGPQPGGGGHADRLPHREQ